MFIAKSGEHVGSSWEELRIKIPAGQVSGLVKTLCPVCSHTRKPEHRNDPCLSVNLDEQIANCHNKGCKFIVNKLGYHAAPDSRTYKQPEQRTIYPDVGENETKWFEGRSIPAKTLKEMKITSGLAWMPQTRKEENTIQFNYFDEDTLVNVKYRDGRKNFRMHGGAKLIFYNLNALRDKEYDTIVITEGEMDALSYIVAGIPYAISVPNGASKGSLNMEYLNNHYHLFEDSYRESNGLKKLKKIILACDDDEPGIALRNEFVRRFGADRCNFVDLKGCNDPNQLLMEQGKVALYNTVDLSVAAPIRDIKTVADMADSLRLLHKVGLQPGDQVGSNEFKKHYSFEKPRLTIVTGVSTHGKSEFLDDIIARLSVEKGWRFGVFSPENFPIEYHISKLVSKIIGKEFNDCSDAELQEAYDFIGTHFFWIYPEDNNYSLENILRINDMLIRRYGVDACIIDPFTEIDKQGKTTTDDINETLSVMNRYKRDNNCHIFLVAHPTKMPKDESGQVTVPDLMNISGSSNFLNKTDGGITVYRDFHAGTVEIVVNKVKFKHLGKLGSITMSYNLKNGRYQSMDDVNQNGWDDTNWLHKEVIQADIFQDSGVLVEEGANVDGYLNATKHFQPTDEEQDDLPF